MVPLSSEMSLAPFACQNEKCQIGHRHHCYSLLVIKIAITSYTSVLNRSFFKEHEPTCAKSLTATLFHSSQSQTKNYSQVHNLQKFARDHWVGKLLDFYWEIISRYDSIRAISIMLEIFRCINWISIWDESLVIKIFYCIYYFFCG